MSRSIGDRIGKDLGIISEPVVTKLENDFDVNRFFVLASDGVWDVMENSEVVNFIETYRDSAKKEFDKVIKGVIVKP